MRGQQKVPQQDDESFGAKRTSTTPEEFARQFQNRLPHTSESVDLIDLLVRYGLARTPEQARLVLAGIIALVLIIVAWQWRSTFSGPSSYPTQADINAALNNPIPPSQ